MSNTFHFKQFSIEQDKCAMKIGTDGVLLAAWLPIRKGSLQILDIGTGTGLIALMLAQRMPEAIIIALEKDSLAAQQAKENFNNSIFKKRISSIETRLQEYENPLSFNIIVSNPPFFEPNKKMVSNNRKEARQSETLTFLELLSKSYELLKKDGSAFYIIPSTRTKEFLKTASSIGFFLKKETKVKGNKDTPVKRSLLELVKIKVPLQTSELTLETERHKYTKEYLNMVKDFYLKL